MKGFRLHAFFFFKFDIWLLFFFTVHSLAVRCKGFDRRRIQVLNAYDLTDITSSHDAVHVSDLYMPTLSESSARYLRRSAPSLPRFCSKQSLTRSIGNRLIALRPGVRHVNSENIVSCDSFSFRGTTTCLPTTSPKHVVMHSPGIVSAFTRCISRTVFFLLLSILVY